MKNLVEEIKEKTQNSEDIICRNLDVLGKNINIVYSEVMIKSSYVSEYVIKNIKDIVKEIVEIEKLQSIVNNTKNVKRTGLEQPKNIEEIIKNLDKNICACKVKTLDYKKDDIYYYLYSCFTLVIYNEIILAIETRGDIDRNIGEIATENSIKGAKDAFNENYENNVALMRKRMKTEDLILNQYKLGRSSKTKIGIMYMSNIVEKEVVEEVTKRIKKIDIDAIVNCNYIIESIGEGKETDFPTIITTERPDLATIYLLQGRVVIVVENSPFVLVVPSFLSDYINNASDYFQKSRNVFFTRLVRYIAFIITIITPGLYVAFITFNHEAIPSELLLSFTAQREGVPFPAVIEALLMILAFEILREGDYRTTNMDGSTLSVVGALILGEAAVSAGIVSSIMIIVIAITALSGLVFSELNLTNAVRNWRIIFLIYGSIGGILGIAVASMLLITKLSSITTFGKEFTYPLAPFNFTRVQNDFVSRKTIMDMRNRYKKLTKNLTSRR